MPISLGLPNYSGCPYHCDTADKKSETKRKLTLSTTTLACSKRSDSGERCGVEKAMKSRGGLGREVTSPPASLLLFRAPFYFAPLPTI